MNNENMKVAHIGEGKDTIMEVPKPPMHLSTGAKKGYTFMGNFLAQMERLKNIYLPTLEVWAVAYDQWQWACAEINRQNKLCPGDGYVQVFKTGAMNISVYVTLRDGAADTMLKCTKLFGLDPKSEKELKAAIETGQLDLFEQGLKSKSS